MGRKYSSLIVSEAVDCYRKLGIKEAVRLTGVQKQTILDAWRKQRLKEGIPRIMVTNQKYTLGEKLACIKLAKKYVDAGYIKKYRAAFIEAGKRLNMNGSTIFLQWSTDSIYGLGEPAQQPGTSRATSGASIQAANPQAQRCSEHQDEFKSLRPPPKIISRRKYTSEDMPASWRKGH